MKLEPIIQTEVSQKEKHQYSIRNGNTLQCSCLENPMDRGAWKAAVHGVAKSWTQLSDFTFTFHFHTLEKEMATHSSILAWGIPWMEELGGLQSMGCKESDISEQLHFHFIFFAICMEKS